RLGERPGTRARTRPGTRPGTRLVLRSGLRLRGRPGLRPAPLPGTRPVLRPGPRPGGRHPRMRTGLRPGMRPGVRNESGRPGGSSSSSPPATPKPSERRSRDDPGRSGPPLGPHPHRGRHRSHRRLAHRRAARHRPRQRGRRPRRPHRHGGGVVIIVDLYAGPGGWSEGLRALGLADIGWEIDEAACATRAAAGHKTIRADVAGWPLDQLVGRVDGIIASPPCQAFSTAGKGTGRQVLDELVDAVARGDWGWSHDDDRVRHVLEVGRWVETIRPRWVACEQVPPVLPVWAAYADRLRHRFGWSTWAGVLNAADWGVPQTRRRAFLIARTDGANVAPPEPTHAPQPSMFGQEPWTSWGHALGLAGVIDRRQQRDGEPVRLVPHTEPSPTLDSQVGGKWVLRYGDRAGTETIRLTTRDALILQGFPPDYPV